MEGKKKLKKLPSIFESTWMLVLNTLLSISGTVFIVLVLLFPSEDQGLSSYYGIVLVGFFYVWTYYGWSARIKRKTDANTT